MRALLLVFVAVVLLGACTSDHRVRGPDGELAHSITCSSPNQCYERAARVCPGGYVIRTAGGTVYGMAQRGNGYVASESNLLVSCKADLPNDAPEPPAESDEHRACRLAFRQAPDFAEYFAKLTPHGKRLDEPPARDDFVAACMKLPDNAQRCLQDHYREEHAKACDAVLTRLDPRDRDRIDALFFEATPADATRERE